MLEFEQAVYALRQLDSAGLADAKRELEGMRPTPELDESDDESSEVDESMHSYM